ncbi:hypothetical protein SMD22_01525 (plasmid) [Brevibacillus halotolerans]|nr:hypothetical protein SMD22_01525 [Brevibacillus halotolerans]
MANTYKEKVKMDWGTTKYVIKSRKKGMLIYREMRENHVKGIVQIGGEEENTVFEHEYLVIDIPVDINAENFRDIYQNDWMALQIRYFPGWTEISCQHPQVFHCGLLQKMQELGYIKYFQKEIPDDKNKFPYYVNAKGWRLLYNIFNMVRETIKRGGKRDFNQSEKSNEDHKYSKENRE